MTTKRIWFYYMIVASMFFYACLVVVRESQDRAIITKLNKFFENSTKPVSNILEGLDQKRKTYVGFVVENIDKYHVKLKEKLSYFGTRSNNSEKTSSGDGNSPVAATKPQNLSEFGFIPWKRDRKAKGYLPAEVLRGHKYLWERTYPRHLREDECKKCFKYQYKRLIVPKVCDGLEKVELIMLVTTVPSAVPQRKAIRQTWGSFSTAKTGNITRHIFMFGTGWPKDQQKVLDAESKEFGDIQQDDYIDSYFNLSIKVLGGYHWFKEHCKMAKFVVRTADDNFVNVPNLIELTNRDNGKKLQTSILGQCASNSPALRSAGSKWYVTRNEYPPSKYPPYCMGTTFLTSKQLTLQIMRTSENVPFFVIEDVYFGMVMKVMYKGTKEAGTKTLPGFNKGPNHTLNKPNVTKCPYGKDWMSLHQVQPQHFQNYWKACGNVTLYS